MRKNNLKILVLLLLLTGIFAFSNDAQAYFWFSGAYRPVLSFDSSTFYVGQDLSRAAGTSSWYGRGFGFGYGFGYYGGWGYSPWRSRYYYPRPSYRQYRLAQAQAQRIVEIRLAQRDESIRQTATLAESIRKQERELENFEKTEGVIQRVDKPVEKSSSEKTPKEVVISKDQTVAVTYY